MKILNLVYPHMSDIQYELRKYPEGQQDIIITGQKYTYRPDFPEKELTQIEPRFDLAGGVTIKSRYTSFQDLELIICATKALRNLKVKKIHLYIPYILGARSDRKFQEGGTRYLKDVTAPLINMLGFESVTVLDPHSDVVENVIENINKIDNVNFVAQALVDTRMKAFKIDGYKEYEFVLVSPDAGAMKKIYNVAEKVRAKDIIIASKHREIETGKILSTEVHISDSNLQKDLIIIDDICDGGRTFIELAKALRQQGATGRIYLVVTHGIFSAGLDVLKEHFNGIYTTNSIKDIDDPFLNQLNIF